MAVHIKHDPYRVVAASSTRHPDLTVKRPPPKALSRFKEIDEPTLASLLGLKPGSKQAKSLKITDRRLVVYQYEAAKRQPEAEGAGEEEEGLVAHDHPSLPLPALPAAIVEDGHYVSLLVHFELGTSRYPTLNWRAIVDVATGAVLHLRPFVDDVNALVFPEDPITTSPSGPLPSAASALLNAKRASVPLQGLNPPSGGTQALQGSIVKVSDVESPAVAPPTEPSGTDFAFDSRTNEFAAVNAYFHCDRFFRMVEGMGFPLAPYFGADAVPEPGRPPRLRRHRERDQRPLPRARGWNGHPPDRVRSRRSRRPDAPDRDRVRLARRAARAGRARDPLPARPLAQLRLLAQCRRQLRARSSTTRSPQLRTGS